MLPSSATRTSAKLGQGSQSPTYSFVIWVLGTQNRAGQGACDSPAPQISAVNTFWSPCALVAWDETVGQEPLCFQHLPQLERLHGGSGMGFFSLR